MWASGATLALATCAPAPQPRVAVAVPERAIREAEPLLRKLGVAVPTAPADLAPAAALPTDAAPPFLASTQSPEDARRAIDCLTAAIYYEARSEPEDGQRAVAQVVLNRVRDRAFPASVCGVVFQGSTRRTGCQFSFTCDGSMRFRRNEEAWERSRVIAGQALAGYVYAPVGSATHYHADYVSPWWAPKLHKLAQVGLHIFYRWPNALERALTFRQRYAGYEPGAAAGGGTPTEIAAALADVAGVTIHRGGDEAGESEDSAAPTRVALTAGVRVHRSREAMAAAAPIAAEEVFGDGVIVSEDTTG